MNLQQNILIKYYTIFVNLSFQLSFIFKKYHCHGLYLKYLTLCISIYNCRITGFWHKSRKNVASNKTDNNLVVTGGLWLPWSYSCTAQGMSWIMIQCLTCTVLGIEKQLITKPGLKNNLIKLTEWHALFYRQCKTLRTYQRLTNCYGPSSHSLQ